MAPDSVVVRTSLGALEGRWSGSVCSFLGIPYAAPPFGKFRMRPPQPVFPWTGTRLATAYGPTAPKGEYPAIYRPYFQEVVIPGEDCLNLNVWTPSPGAAGLPVLVWIHGGSFANGSSSIREYAGWSFARDGVVCVTINYRLGLEGFLYLDDGLANLGLLDQIAALEWVHANIAAFGGDPSKVTIAGESAGAMSVTCHLASPLAEGLFTRAIAQSGYAADTLTPAQASLVARHAAETLAIANSRDEFRNIPPRDLALLSASLVEEIELHPDAAKWGDVGSPFSPTVDGNLLPCNLLEGFEQGRGDNVALLIGSNQHEARLTLVADGTIDALTEDDLGTTAQDLGLSAEGVHAYRRLHPSASPGDLVATVLTDWFYSLSPIRVAEARSGHKTWVYRFDHPDTEDNHGLGSCHGAELPYVFDCVDLPEVRPRIGDSPNQNVADLTHGTWVRFVGNGTTGWPSYSLPERPTAIIREGLHTSADPHQTERLIWEGLR